eukprot:scaffold53093_cov81-Phaeocystis_antarctica.AAC.3
MTRLRRPFPWVAPRACATSARLMARCGSVWRAMAMSLGLPQGTHRVRGVHAQPGIILRFNLHADL